MLMRTIIGQMTFVGTLVVSPAASAIDITAATNASDAATFANLLIGGNSSLTLNSASFLISVQGGGTTPSELRALGQFTDGNAVGTLPAVNQFSPPVSYAGGIGIASGICLSTGLVTDDDSSGASAADGSGVGLQGPNNGFALTELFDESTQLNAGEISFVTNRPPDTDFASKVKSVNASDGDASVIQFQVAVSSPGFLRISFVFGSDEHRFWIDEQSEFDVNDSLGILVRQDFGANQEFVNIALLREPGMPPKSMSLRDLRNCGPLMFRNNQVAPAPSSDLILGKLGNFPTSLHGFDVNLDGFNRPDDGVPYFNIELGGFTKKLTRETFKPLATGNYTIKIVVQDILDRNVDSAVFIETGSLKLFVIAPGDYNGNGVVDAADYTVWRDHFGATGNKDFCADFNRDGAVNLTDLTIMAPYYQTLHHCASRFEGDADGDGDVDQCDLDILLAEMNSGVPSQPCACGGGGALMAATSGFDAGGAVDAASFKQKLPASPDVDGNGEVGAEELSELDALIAELSGSSAEESLVANESEEAAPALREPAAHDSSSQNDSPTPANPSTLPGNERRETSLLVTPPRD